MSGAAPSPFYPADNPAATTHINVLQGIINRLAGASASCKTWCLTLVAAVLSLAATAHVPPLAKVALVPTVIFGFLDAMYLAQEKAHRDLYAHVVAEMQSKRYDIQQVFMAGAPMTCRHFRSALRSWSVWPFYLGLLVIYLIAEWGGYIAQFAVRGN